MALPPAMILIRLLAAAWIGYYVYQQKRQMVWAIISAMATFSLPILSIVIVLLARDRTGQRPKSSFRRKNQKKLAVQLCSKCGHETTRPTSTCPNCGNNLSLVE